MLYLEPWRFGRRMPFNIGIGKRHEDDYRTVSLGTYLELDFLTL